MVEEERIEVEKEVEVGSKPASEPPGQNMYPEEIVKELLADKIRMEQFFQYNLDLIEFSPGSSQGKFKARIPGDRKAFDEKVAELKSRGL